MICTFILGSHSGHSKGEDLSCFITLYHIIKDTLEDKKNRKRRWKARITTPLVRVAITFAASACYYWHSCVEFWCVVDNVFLYTVPHQQTYLFYVLQEQFISLMLICKIYRLSRFANSSLRILHHADMWQDGRQSEKSVSGTSLS